MKTKCNEIYTETEILRIKTVDLAQHFAYRKLKNTFVGRLAKKKKVFLRHRKALSFVHGSFVLSFVHGSLVLSSVRGSFVLSFVAVTLVTSVVVFFSKSVGNAMSTLKLVQKTSVVISRKTAARVRP